MSQTILPGSPDDARPEPERESPAGTTAATSEASPPAPAPPEPRSGRRVVAGITGLMAVAVVFRTEGMGMSFWLDEGLSVGIASHPFVEIPGLMVQDGSPPLYYLVLHLWMLAFGSSEVAVRALSLLFGLAAIPLAFWAGDSLFGRRVAWGAAVLAATSSYLAFYSREARMYTLLVLGALVCVTAFAHVFVFGRRRWLPVVVISLAVTLYTHNWGLYLALGLAAGAGCCLATRPARRRRILLDGALVTGAVALLYAPWVPTLVSQAMTTGAPWSQTPGIDDLAGVLGSIVDHDGIVIAFALVGLPALVALARRWRPDDEALAVVTLAAALTVSMVASWMSSLLEPGWAGRYFGLFLPTVVLLMALGLAREGRRGALALAVIAFLSAQPFTRFPGLLEYGPAQKSNVRRAVLFVDEYASEGDVVLSTQMEHVPLLRYYLGPSLRYADPAGVVDDPQIVDWRHATQRMRAARMSTTLTRLTSEMDAGGHLFVVCPRSDHDEDRLSWFVLMDRHCQVALRTLERDPAIDQVYGPVAPTPRRAAGSSVFITVYEKLTGTLVEERR